MKYILHHPQAIHEIGQRDNQEDCIFPAMGKADRGTRLFIVCDGMGGHEKGEVASNTVCHALAEYIKSHCSADDIFTKDMFAEALEYAYQQLDKRDNGAFKKMGTTLTLLYIHKGGVFAAHIGDSRIYHIRPDKGIMYMSRDHSLAFDLFQCGEITYEEMLNYPQKNVITRAMQPGENNRVKADVINITDVKPGDYFYLCSDGMLEDMSNETLFEIFNSKQKDEEKRRRLLSATTKNKDNHSAYIVHVGSLVMEDGDDSLTNEEQTARCNAMNIFSKHNVMEEETPSSVEKEENVSIADGTLMKNKPKNIVRGCTSTTSSKKTLWRKYIWQILIVLIAIITIVVTALHIKTEKEDKSHPTMTQPIKRSVTR